MNFFKSILIVCLTFFGVANSMLGFETEVPQTLLILNAANHTVMPKNFRTASSTFVIKPDTTYPLPTREALDDLPISGSGQFSEKSLKLLLQHLNVQPETCYIVDLREESHGFFNGAAVSWTGARNWTPNRGLDPEEIQKNERELIQKALAQQNNILYTHLKKDPLGINLPQGEEKSILVEKAETERELVTRFGAHYIRLPSTDHVRPTDAIVDSFVKFVSNLPKDHWVHFHCSAGMGRSTTAMVMYDMMVNAKQISFDDIIRRHRMLGGTNLVKKYEPTLWKAVYMEERVEFLKDFYRYCLQNRNNFEQSWLQYSKS